MKTSAVVAAIVVGLAAVQGVQAQQSQPGHAVPVYGVGNWSCGKWVEARKSKDRINENVMVQWTQGFLTAMSSLARLKITDAEGLKVSFDNYCQANPTKNIEDAAGQLMFTLQSEAQ